MPNVTFSRCLTALAITALAACSGQTPGAAGFAPAAAPATSATTSFAPDNGKCPGKDIACVTVSYGSPAQYSFCFIPSGSQCNGGQFTWSSTFRTEKGKLFKGLLGTFTPNPGDPSTDYISEIKPLASSHGNVKYQQTIFACVASGCEGPYHIGVITQ